jgi:hypothetical protein
MAAVFRKPMSSYYSLLPARLIAPKPAPFGGAYAYFENRLLFGPAVRIARRASDSRPLDWLASALPYRGSKLAPRSWVSKAILLELFRSHEKAQQWH